MNHKEHEEHKVFWLYKNLILLRALCALCGSIQSIVYRKVYVHLY